MIRPVSAPTVAFLTCTCGHPLIVREDGCFYCTHTVTISDNGREQQIEQRIRHRVAVVTELVGGGVK